MVIVITIEGGDFSVFFGELFGVVLLFIAE
jgi:hypothetical protein